MSGSIVQTFDTESKECLDIEWLPDEKDVIFEDEDCFCLYPSGVFTENLEQILNETKLISQEEYNKLLDLYTSWYFYLDNVGVL